MSAWDGEQETEAPARSYSDAEAAADFARYRKLKRTVSIRSLVLVALVGLACIAFLPVPSAALIVGGLGGVVNALLLMRSGERVVETRKIRTFVISSFLRIAVFGIVPVAFAAVGPWWSMAWYFAGFFLPLALYAITVGRTSGRE
jgi:hypothetical protein